MRPLPFLAALSLLLLSLPAFAAGTAYLLSTPGVH